MLLLVAIRLGKRLADLALAKPLTRLVRAKRLAGFSNRLDRHYCLLAVAGT